MWERRDGGYFIVADEMVKMALDIQEQRDRRYAVCAARRYHRPADDDKDGWSSCEDCFIPLQRPDGGPVALPDGGPLGPSSRDDEE